MFLIFFSDKYQVHITKTGKNNWQVKNLEFVIKCSFQSVWFQLETHGDPLRPLRGKAALKVHQLVPEPRPEFRVHWAASSAHRVLHCLELLSLVVALLACSCACTEQEDGVFCTFQMLMHKPDGFPALFSRVKPHCSSRPSLEHARHIWTMAIMGYSAKKWDAVQKKHFWLRKKRDDSHMGKALLWFLRWGEDLDLDPYSIFFLLKWYEVTHWNSLQKIIIDHKLCVDKGW